MSGGLSRRGFLTGAVATAAGSALAMPERARSRQTSERTLRVAYITDIHLDNHFHCISGLARCLHQINRLPERPDLIIQGGDMIMDGLSRDAVSVDKQYRLASEVIRRHTSIPIQHVIGNHDVWGWDRVDAPQLQSDPRFGKRWWLNWTGYTSTYRSFDRGGWHFVLLDSIAPERRGFSAKLDDAQAKWLEQDLANTPPSTPVCMVSHVPILSTGAMFFGPAEQGGHWHLPQSLMHMDARWIKNLLVKHPNVKICLSGHIHMADRVDYNGVKHFGVGAVCGAWWRGPMQETPPQFALVDFYEDGSSHLTTILC